MHALFFAAYAPTIATNFSKLMWIEKYRTLTVDQIRDHRLRQLVNDLDEKPPLLFAGPAGVGKTATALCIAQYVLNRNKLLGKLPVLIHRERRRDNSGLSESHESEYSMVRVTDFLTLIKVIADKEYESHFMVIIIDDADEMTPEVQIDLLRMIEECSKTTHFIVICNSLSSIIEPVQRKCMVFQFTKLTTDYALQQLKRICQKEEVPFEDKALLDIYEAASGNLRHSVNILQAAAGMGSVSHLNVLASITLSVRSKVGEVIRLALADKIPEVMVILSELTNEFSAANTWKRVNDQMHPKKSSHWPQ